MPVRAAGGVVLRPGAGGSWEVALVYRSSRSDWGFPKGKLEPGETELFCARREVEEETGLLCNVVSYVGKTEYVDRRDRPKTVEYWIMEPLEGEFEPTDEVDDMQWVPIDLARRVLTYGHDRELLEIVSSSLHGRSMAARA
jgi:8-oxo-dGTP pyrophosphatase MutT (NUDIX family)